MSVIKKWRQHLPARVRQAWRGVDLLPIRRVFPDYAPAQVRADLRAGFTGALIAFPQAVACALIAGVPLVFGLMGSAVASILGPLFSRSRIVVLGPTNSTAVLLLSSFLVAGVATDVQRAGMLAIVVALAGLLQVLAAYLNVGSLIAYISRSVIVGYVSAAVLMIIANQLKNLFGLPAEDESTFLAIVQSALRHITHIHVPTLLVAVATALVFFGLRRFAPRVPTIPATLLVSIGFGLIARHQDIPLTMLPAVTADSVQISLPVFDFTVVNQLASAALAIAFLGILESNSVGKLLAARAGERYNSNQEAFALGMSNLGNAILGGMPASGSPTRSVLNFTSGAATPVASIICGVLMLGLIFGLGGFVDLIPRASLAVVVVLVAIALFNRRQITFVVRSTRYDAIVFFVTAGAGLLFPLDAAIFFGTATSIVLYLRQAGEPEFVEYAFNPAGHLAAVPEGEQRPLPEISIVHVEGSLFFGAAELLHEQVRRVCADPNLKVIILRLKHAHHLDASAVLALEELVQFMRENGRALIVSGARKEVTRICRRTGLLDLIGRENFFVEWSANPTLSTRNAMRRAQQIIGSKEADVRVFSEAKMKPAT